MPCLFFNFLLLEIQHTHIVHNLEYQIGNSILKRTHTYLHIHYTLFLKEKSFMENGISNRCFKQNIHRALKKDISINRAINK